MSKHNQLGMLALTIYCFMSYILRQTVCLPHGILQPFRVALLNGVCRSDSPE
jgi:hypothetical protein